MKITLLAHTRIAEEFKRDLENVGVVINDQAGYNERQSVSLTAIRTCYSPNEPSEILVLEGSKYFDSPAADGEGGSDADRLCRHILNSKHTSTLEHISYSFAVEGVSRSLLAQLTRHRSISFSVQSQRYVRFGSNDKSGGFSYVTPPSIQKATADELFKEAMNVSQDMYDTLRAAGVSAEDARYILPNAATCNLVMTLNLSSLLAFYSKRKRGSGAQWEIADLAEILRTKVVAVDPWVSRFFAGGAIDGESAVK